MIILRARFAHQILNDPCEYENLWDKSGSGFLKVKLLKDSYDASVMILDSKPKKTAAY
jgi:hypothetical protein